jgi:hypothetical protein
MKKTKLMGLMLGTMAAALIAVLDSSTAAVSFASDDGPTRSDRACENMLDLVGKRDARTEPNSDHPDSDRGAQKAHEGSVKALGDCPVG